YTQFLQNIRDNGVTNIVPVNKAVAGKSGTMQMMVSSSAFSISSDYFDIDRFSETLEDTWNRQTVDCISLDDIFAQYQIDRCAWMKIDCEGGEYDILSHAGVLERVDRITMELHVPP